MFPSLFYWTKSDFFSLAKSNQLWWDLNPSFSSAPSRGWLLREQGRIVGFLGTIPIKMQLAGKESLSFGGTTWRVAPEFRGTSMLLKRRQMEDQKDHLHASTTPRREVAKMMISEADTIS